MTWQMARQGNGLALMAGFAVLSYQPVPASGAAAGDEALPARQGRHLSGRPAGKPAHLWVWYPEEGNRANTEEGPYCSGLSPPAFTCGFGANVDDCKRQVHTYLDAWYADFNLVFTLTRPSADYYTIVVTNHGGWCPSPPEGGMAGIAYASGCNDITGYAGYVFSCENAHDCATVIAHEHAHMVGLQHTDSITDVMNWRVHATANGFDNQDNLTVNDTCDYLSQNSYQRMLATLGAWPGGPKPSPFADLPDAGAADVASPEERDAGSSGTPIGPGGPTIDGGLVGVVGGYDALVRPTVPTVDAARATPTSGGGCRQARGSPTPASLLLALVVPGLAALTRARGRRPARHARPAGEPLPCAAPARSPSGVPARDRR